MSQETASERNIVLRIRRQDRPDASQRWEEFVIPWLPNLNIIAGLQYIAAHPVTADGKQTTPVVYDSGCLEEVCGACTMLINGKTRQACSALVDKLEPAYGRGRRNRSLDEPITLEPMGKFPLVRDLLVDRQRLLTISSVPNAGFRSTALTIMGQDRPSRRNYRRTATRFLAASVAAVVWKHARNIHRSIILSAPRYSPRSSFSTSTPPAPP